MEQVFRLPDWQYGDDAALRVFLGLEKTGFETLIKDGTIWPPDLEINRQQKYWSRLLAGKIALVLPDLLRLREKSSDQTDT